MTAGKPFRFYAGPLPWARSAAQASLVAAPKGSPGLLVVVTMAFSLLASAMASPAVAQEEETEGITGYVACLDAAVRRIDDGRSGVAAVAAAAVGACAARFPETIPGRVSAAAQRKYEKRVQARQMELGVMVVQDLRGEP